MKTQIFDNGNVKLTLIRVIDNKQDFRHTHEFEVRFNGDDSSYTVSINMNVKNDIKGWLVDNCDIDPTNENEIIFLNFIS